MHVTYLSQDRCAGNWANTQDRSDVLQDLLNEFSNLGIYLSYLFLQQVNLLQQATHFHAYCIGQ